MSRYLNPEKSQPKNFARPGIEPRSASPNLQT